MASSSGNFWKFFWSALDRVFFIAMGVVGTVATAYITGILKVNPPELVARPAYNTVEAAPVASKIGGLALNYKADAPRSYGVLRVDIANEGRGAAEKVRFQVKLDPSLGVSYEKEPDFKVYRPSEVKLAGSEFYTELATLPSGAADFVALRISGDRALLAGTRIKLVNDEYEGEVEQIKGIGDQ